MKHLLLVVVTGLVIGAWMPKDIQGEEINWITVEEAEALQAKEPKKILIDVYTTWCGPCKKMSANTLTDKKVVAYINEHYYAVKLNAETSKVVKFNGKTYSKQGRFNKFASKVTDNRLMFPTTSILDTDKELISAVPGYFGSKEYLKILKFFNEEHYKTMTWEEYKKKH